MSNYQMIMTLWMAIATVLIALFGNRPWAILLLIFLVVPIKIVRIPLGIVNLYPQTFMALYVFFALILAWVLGIRRAKGSFADILIVLMCIGMALGATRNPDMGQGFVHFFHIASTFITLFIFQWLIKDKDQMKNTAFYILAFSLVGITNSLLFGKFLDQYGAGNRLDGSFGNANAYALFVAPMGAFALPMALDSSYGRGQRLIMIIAFFASCLSLLLTGSRGGIVALAAGISFIFIFGRMAWQKRTVVGGIMVIAALGGAFYILQRRSSTYDIASMNYRKVVTLLCIRKIKENPLMGTGIGSISQVIYDEPFAQWLAAEQEGAWEGVKRHANAHNAYMQLATEGGLPLLSIYLALLFSVLFFSLKNINSFGSPSDKLIGIGLAAACIAFMTQSLTESALQNVKVNWIYGVFAGLLLACGRICYQKRAKLSEKSEFD